MNVARLTQKIIKPLITKGTVNILKCSFANIFSMNLTKKSLTPLPIHHGILTSQIIYMNSN